MYESVNLRPLDFGEVLDGAFSTYRRHFRPLFATALIPSVILAAAMFTLGGIETFAVGEGALIFLIAVLYLGGMTLSIVVWAALVSQVGTALLSGQTPTLNRGLEHGMRRTPALVGAILVILFAGSAGVFAGAMIVGVGAVLHVAFGILLGLGLFAASIAYFTSLFGVLPAAVLEEKGPIESIGRSWRLARGSLLRIFGLLAVTWIITSVPMMVGGVLIGIGAVAGELLSSVLVVVLSSVLVVAAYAILLALTMPFTAAVLTLLFLDRIARTRPTEALGDPATV